MKILHFVNENRLSWVEPYIQLISYLDASGVDNILMCNPGGTLSAKARAKGIKVLEYKPVLPAVPLFSRKAGEIILKTAPDIIHTRLSSASLIGGYWGKRLDIPVISTIDKFAKIKYNRFSDVSVAVSSSIKDWMKGYGYKSEKIEVIPNPVDVKFYSLNQEVRDETRKKWGIEDNEIVIAGAGRFEHEKGFDVLIKAVERLPRGMPFRLWLAGDGPEKEKLKSLVRKYSFLEDKMEFWGFVDDIRPFLWASDIFVLPSREPESFGLILLEAMASGLPVIATLFGGPLDIVDEACGWFVPPDDIDGLHSVLQNAMNRELLSQKGKGSLKKIAMFDVISVGDRYYDLYLKNSGKKARFSQ